MSDISDEKQKSWQFQKGQSGNPNGRPKRSFSIKTRIIQKLEENPERLDKMIDYLIDNQPALVWQMIDGRPTQTRDTVNNELPIPILQFDRVFIPK